MRKLRYGKMIVPEQSNQWKAFLLGPIFCILRPTFPSNLTRDFCGGKARPIFWQIPTFPKVIFSLTLNGCQTRWDMHKDESEVFRRFICSPSAFVAGDFSHPFRYFKPLVSAMSGFFLVRRQFIDCSTIHRRPRGLPARAH